MGIGWHGGPGAGLGVAETHAWLVCNPMELIGTQDIR
jgi:hypothetical protein